MSQVKAVTPAQAVLRAWLTITFPSLILLFAPAKAYLAWVPNEHRHGALFGLVLLASVSASWLLWSILVPRWRLWAYERVEDIAKLKRLAVRFGILWPEGNVFERTEIASKELRERIRKIEQAKNESNDA
jgi:hypothetical protein